MKDTVLKSSISVNFDEAQRFTTNSIKIEGMPVTPGEGQSIRIRWDDFVEDKALVQKLEDFEEDDMFLVHVVTIEIRKDEVITHVVLMAEADYKHHYGNLKLINFSDLQNSSRVHPY